MSYKIDNKFEINENVIRNLTFKIILAEKENIKTKNKSDTQLVREIKKWIQDEVKNCYLDQLD